MVTGIQGPMMKDIILAKNDFVCTYIVNSELINGLVLYPVWNSRNYNWFIALVLTCRVVYIKNVN